MNVLLRLNDDELILWNFAKFEGKDDVFFYLASTFSHRIYRCSTLLMGTLVATEEDAFLFFALR